MCASLAQIIAASICPPLICTRFVRFRVPDVDPRRAIGSFHQKEPESLKQQPSAAANSRRSRRGCGGGGSDSCCSTASTYKYIWSIRQSTILYCIQYFNCK